MLRNIQLPPEYARGLQDLLLKEQQDDQMAVQTDIQQKQVRIAELQAEAEAAQKVKEAEGDAQARVVEAKGEADAMQYTLPLKQKQIEQSKLEAEARKEATIENADAEAQAKVIDSKAELQRRELLAQAEANRIRVTAAADAERMASEAKLLNESPLLINKIIAERLVGQNPDGHGAVRRQVLLRQRCVSRPRCKPGAEAGADAADGPRRSACGAGHFRTLKRAAEFGLPPGQGLSACRRQAQREDLPRARPPRLSKQAAGVDFPGTFGGQRGCGAHDIIRPSE